MLSAELKASPRPVAPADLVAAAITLTIGEVMPRPQETPAVSNPQPAARAPHDAAARAAGVPADALSAPTSVILIQPVSATYEPSASARPLGEVLAQLQLEHGTILYEGAWVALSDVPAARAHAHRQQRTRLIELAVLFVGLLVMALLLAGVLVLLIGPA